MDSVSHQVVDLVFSITARGRDGRAATLPVDHGYALFAAISRHLTWVHGRREVGIHPISGRLAGGRRLMLTPRSTLTFRVPPDLIPELLPLAGQVLDVEGTALHIGVPMVRPLRPAARLRSRLVVIKGMVTPDTFLAAARAQLEAQKIAGVPRLLPRPSRQPVEHHGLGGREPWVRRTLRVRDRTVVGYALEVTQLSAAAAVQLQAVGLGGRRRFGCGIFVPVPEGRA